MNGDLAKPTARVGIATVDCRNKLVGGFEGLGGMLRGHRLAEQLCDFAQQVERMHGFCEDLETMALFTGSSEQVACAGLAGEEQNAAVRVDLSHPESEFYSIQLRHHHVGEKEVRPCQLSRFGSVGRIDKGPDSEAPAEKNEFEGGRDYVFVIDDEGHSPA